jgi:VanZ family protein
LPAVVVAGAVLVLSLVPLGGGALSSASGGGVHGVGLDKLLHVVDYATIALTLLYATRARTARACLVAFAAAAVLGGAIELLQGPIPMRDASLLDAVANAVGAAVATGGWWVRRVILGGTRPG